MKRLVNASKNFVLLITKPKDMVESKSFQGCDIKLNHDLAKVVNTYESMFREHERFNPNRGIQCEIQSQQDAPLPNIGMYRVSIFENAKIN